eukprot:3545575-Lingulodinium_polyedra.AAC.1
MGPPGTAHGQWNACALPRESGTIAAGGTAACTPRSGGSREGGPANLLGPGIGAIVRVWGSPFKCMDA